MNKTKLTLILVWITLISFGQDNKIQPTGNIGIGTTNPNKLFHVEAKVSGDHSAIVENKNTGGYGMIINAHNDPLRVGTLGDYSGNFFIVKGTGYVGIGTNNPTKTLHVKSNLAGNHSAIIENNSSTGYGLILNSANDPLRIGSLGNHSGNYFIIRSNGNIGVGTTNPQNKLSVNGTLWATEVKVSLTDGADWVFENDYDLRTLEEVEKYVNENKHLPEIPTAEEFRQNDLNVAEMDNKLLQKIEELTLYMIDINKRVKQLEQENSELKENNLELQREVSDLKNRSLTISTSKAHLGRFT